MNSLAIGFMHNNAWFVLKGDDLPAGILGTEYVPTMQNGEAMDEVLRVGLRGGLADIHLVIRALQTQINLLQKYRQDGIGNPLYLRAHCAEDDRDYYSEITSAHLETRQSLVNPLETGSLLLELHVRRLNHWDSAEIALPLSNANGSGISTPLTVHNRNDGDAGHQNFFIASGGLMQTDMPAPLRLEFCNTHTSGDLDDLYIGAYTGGLLGSCPQMVYECEDADSGALSIADASCSAGAYSQNTLVSSGPGATFSAVLSWGLSTGDLNLWNGRWVLPVLRMQGAHTIEGLQFRLSLSAGSGVIYESWRVDFSSGGAYQVFPALRLPVGDLPRAGSPLGQSLRLEACYATAGSHLLNLDYLMLLPMDYFSLERAITPLAYGQKLVEDAFSGKSWSEASGAELKTHQRIGTGLSLERDQLTHFFCFQTQSNGLAPIARTGAVRAWYRRRKRIL